MSRGPSAVAELVVVLIVYEAATESALQLHGSYVKLVSFCTSAVCTTIFSWLIRNL